MASGTLCNIDNPDVTIVLKNQSIPFRWDLLTEASPVFEALSRWSQRKEKISLDFLSEAEDIIIPLLDYISAGMYPIIVGSCLIVEMLHVCDMLYLDNLGHFCKDALINIPLTLVNCCDILFTCSLYNVYHVTLEKFIKGHLNELTDNRRMVGLTYDSLLSLLQDEHLSYWPVEKRLTLTLEWCNADNARILSAETLLSAIDIEHVDQRVLGGLNSYNSYFVLAKAFEALNVQEGNSTFGINDDIHVAYLLDECHTHTLFAFNIESLQFMRVNFPKEIPVPFFPEIVRKDGRIVCVPSGGKNKPRTIIHQYNPTTKTHEKHKIMTVPDVNEIFEIDEQLIIICTVISVAPGKYSTMYKCVNEEGGVLEVEPLYSFAFEVSYVPSLNQSMYLHGSNSALYRFDLSTCSLESIKGNCIRYFGTSTIVQLNQDTVFLSGDNAYHVSAKQIEKLGQLLPYSIVNEYMSVSGRVLRCTGDYMRLYQHIPQKDILLEDNWTMIKVPQIISFSKNLNGKLAIGFIKRTEPVCHCLCPHCDPDAEEEETMLQLSRGLYVNSSTCLPPESELDSDEFIDDYYMYDDYYSSGNSSPKPCIFEKDAFSYF